MEAIVRVLFILTVTQVPSGSSEYNLPDDVPDPVISTPFDSLEDGYTPSTPKDLYYGSVTPTAVHGKIDGAVTLASNATLYRGYGSEPFDECMTSPKECSKGLSMCLWFRQTPEERKKSEPFIPNTVFSTGVENFGIDVVKGSGMGMFLRPSGLMKVWVRTEELEYMADLPAYLFEETENWHAVCVTFSEENGLKTYYQGQVRDWDQYGHNRTGGMTITHRLIFGRPYQAPRHFFYGSFDNFFMWVRELSATNVMDIYKAAPTGCEDCDPNGECKEEEDGSATCSCKGIFASNDGRQCQTTLNEGGVPTPKICWNFNEGDTTPAVGNNAGVKENDLLTITPGLQGRAVVLNGRHTWLDGNEHTGQCISAPDECAADGISVGYWIRYIGRGGYDNYIFSTGGRGAKNTGICCWVKETTMKCRVQMKVRRWQADAEVTRGVWHQHTIVWHPESGLQIIINGQTVGVDQSGKSKTVPNEKPTMLTIGAANHDQTLTGRFDIDNMAFWEVKLTDDAIQNFYNEGLSCHED